MATHTLGGPQAASACPALAQVQMEEALCRLAAVAITSQAIKAVKAKWEDAALTLQAAERGRVVREELAPKRARPERTACAALTPHTADLLSEEHSRRR